MTKFTDKVREFVKARGMSDEEIDSKIKSYFDADNGFGQFLKKKGGIENDDAVEAAHRALYMDVCEGALKKKNI